MAQPSLDLDNATRIKIPPVFAPLAQPMRYKSFYGGRGGAKSWAFARMLIGTAAVKKVRILCTRELQTSIKESVHRLLSDQIEALGLSNYYDVQRDSIKSACGSEFFFKGIRFNVQEIKSMEGIDICWAEEAQSMSEESWGVLIPTIRKENSEIWLSWNTGEVDDPTYQRFVINTPPDCICQKVSWRDNPYFPDVLKKERIYLQRVNPEAYNHIWEGDPLKISEASVFRGKYVIEEFDAPKHTRFHFGADWGFSNDPTTLVRSYIHDGELWIDYEAYGIGVELDQIAELFDSVPGSREGRIKADSSRPDTISYIKRKGFDIVACLKWGSGAGTKGSVKEGITYLQNFPKIHIHPRCKHTAEEFKMYSYKTDKRTGEVLPILEDGFDHCIDSMRYAYDRETKGGYSWGDLIDD